MAGEEVFDGALLHVRRDRVRLPDGSEAVREYIRHPGAVTIVALLDDGRVLLERQYRYPLGREFIELPAGKIDPGEAHLDDRQARAARGDRLRRRRVAAAGIIHDAIGYTDERIELWLARGPRAARPEARRRGVPRDVQPAARGGAGDGARRPHHRREDDRRPAMAGIGGLMVRKLAGFRWHCASPRPRPWRGGQGKGRGDARRGRRAARAHRGRQLLLQAGPHRGEGQRAGRAPGEPRVRHHAAQPSYQGAEAGLDVEADLGTEPKKIAFKPTAVGKYPIYCSKKLPFIAGHREKGMEGVLEVVP